MTDIVKESYNKFSQYPLYSYKCIEYLINDTNAELLWKILYYKDSEAYKFDDDHPNLTASQKRGLIYDGGQNPQDFNVFMDVGMDNTFQEESCIIRISPFEILPVKQSIGNITMAFEVFCHYKLSTMSNYQTRVDTITQIILNSLNGQSIDGIGRLYFNMMAARQCKSIPIGQIPYRGRRTIMCNWTV